MRDPRQRTFPAMSASSLDAPDKYTGRSSISATICASPRTSRPASVRAHHIERCSCGSSGGGLGGRLKGGRWMVNGGCSRAPPDGKLRKRWRDSLRSSPVRWTTSARVPHTHMWMKATAAAAGLADVSKTGTSHTITGSAAHARMPKTSCRRARGVGTGRGAMMGGAARGRAGHGAHLPPLGDQIQELRVNETQGERRQGTRRAFPEVGAQCSRAVS